MYCINCGHKLPNGAKYCCSCGHPVSTDVVGGAMVNDEIFNSALDIVVTDDTLSLNSETVVDDVIQKARFAGDSPSQIIHNNTQTSLIQTQSAVNEVENEVEEPMYPQETSTSYFGGTIIIKEISYSEDDIIYRIYDSEGAFEEDFEFVEKCVNKYLIKAKCLKDGLCVLLQIDLDKKRVKYATKHRCNKIETLHPDLYLLHGNTLKYNELWQWDSSTQKIELIYQTPCWINIIDSKKCLYRLCRSYNDYWQYGIIKVEYGRVKTIMPVICNEVLSSNLITYNGNSSCYLSNDGWLYTGNNIKIITTWWGLLLAIASISATIVTSYITNDSLHFIGGLFLTLFIVTRTHYIKRKEVDISALIKRLNEYAKRYSHRKNKEDGKLIIDEICTKESKIFNGLHFVMLGQDIFGINCKTDDKWYKKRGLWSVVILILYTISLLGFLWINSADDNNITPMNNIEISEDNANNGLTIYTNNYYGFTLKYPSDLKIQSNTYNNLYLKDDDGDTKMYVIVQEINHPYTICTERDALTQRVNNYKMQFDITKNIYIAPEESNINDWIVASGYLPNGVCLYDKTIIASRKKLSGEQVYILVSVIVETTDKTSGNIAHHIRDYFKVENSGILIGNR